MHAFSGSNRFVLDYLAEEVLARQEPEIQEFLLKTSILERMNASLCDAVMGHSARCLRLHRPTGLPGEIQSLRGGTGQQARLVPLSPSLCGPAAGPARPEAAASSSCPASARWRLASRAASSWRKPSRTPWQPVRWSGQQSWLNGSPYACSWKRGQPHSPAGSMHCRRPCCEPVPGCACIMHGPIIGWACGNKWRSGSCQPRRLSPDFPQRPSGLGRRQLPAG